jgi:hypothetical protein
MIEIEKFLAKNTGSLFQGYSVDLLLSQVSAMHGHDKLVLLMEKAANKEIAYLESTDNEELSLRMTRYSVVSFHLAVLFLIRIFQDNDVKLRGICNKMNVFVVKHYYICLVFQRFQDLLRKVRSNFLKFLESTKFV